tara:strand:+ start:840 stop:1667 length:828 start_codon:yes stop_codon:yes gene_type:complete
MLVNNITETFIKTSNSISDKVAGTDSSIISLIFSRESLPFSDYFRSNKIVATTVLASAILYLSYKVYAMVSRLDFHQVVKGKLEISNNTAANSLAPATKKFDHQEYKTRLLQEKAKLSLVNQATYIQRLLREKFLKIDKLDYEKNINFILEDLDETVAEQIRILILADIESKEYSWGEWSTLSTVEINSDKKEHILKRICEGFNLDFKRKVTPTPTNNKSITPAALSIFSDDSNEEERSAFTKVTRKPASNTASTRQTPEKVKKTKCGAANYYSF